MSHFQGTYEGKNPYCGAAAWPSTSSFLAVRSTWFRPVVGRVPKVQKGLWNKLDTGGCGSIHSVRKTRERVCLTLHRNQNVLLE